MKKKWLLPLMVMMSLAITFPVQAAPKVGEVLGHIVNEQADPKITGTGRLMEAYRTGIVGQCTWYARGRFKEVHGIELPYLGNAKNWITAEEKCAEVEVITDIWDILEQTIAVYAPRTNSKLAGHVCFIEYVERDAKGNPQYVYYTDANGKYDTQQNKYTEGCDGAVIKESFQTFKGTKQLKLVGYIAAKETTE